jgi:hypothetical protein
MNNIRYQIQKRKIASFFDECIFKSYQDYWFYSIVGVVTAAGVEANAEPPRSVHQLVFLIKSSKKSSWME